MQKGKIKIAVFASGNGSNFQALAEACSRGDIPAEISLCVCDHPEAYVCQRAENLGIELLAFKPKEFSSKAEFERMLVGELNNRNIDLICLAGYMRIVGEELLSHYDRKILNIHPALLPAFKGAHAIEDSFNYGVKIYGVTVHYVDASLDGGTIIDQEALRYEGRDIDLLEEKIHTIEHYLYPRAVNKWIADNL